LSLFRTTRRTGTPAEVRPEAGSPHIRLSDPQRFAWLKLIRTENVGPATFIELINRYGSAAAALEALPELARRGGQTRIRIPADAEIAREWDAAARSGARLVALGEAGYPPYLRAVEGPPPMVAVLGSVEVLARPLVAIVGSRNASLSGRKIAGMIARGLGGEGIGIVSGLARGIDAAAHEASVPTGTVAVLAGGLDRIYPPEHEGLLARIVGEGGAGFSEMPYGWEPRARDFPRRNRLISGMSIGVVVVEAARRSGSLHTARFAAEQGREVFAVPGSPLDPRAEGCNDLIRTGATLVSGAADVLESIADQIGRPPPEPSAWEPASDDPGGYNAPAEDLRARVVEALGPTPVSIDELIRHTGAPPGLLQTVLLELYLAGRATRHPGGKVSLNL
jgi:DNA processing protein